MNPVVLPLRVPLDVDLDLQGPLSHWLDSRQPAEACTAISGGGKNPQQRHPANGSAGDGQYDNDGADEDHEYAVSSCEVTPDVTAEECQDDLYRLTDLRRRVARALVQEDYAQAMAALPLLQEYAAALLQFEQRGFIFSPVAASADPEEVSSYFEDLPSDDRTGKSGHDNPKTTATTKPSTCNLVFRWTTGSIHRKRDQRGESCDAYGSLLCERANILWNIVALEAYQATQKSLTDTKQRAQIGGHLANAAAILRQIRQELYPAPKQQNPKMIAPAEDSAGVDVGNALREDERRGVPWSGLALSASMLHIWESYLIAEAQRAAYGAFRMLPRPRQFMLAKFSAAAVPLFQYVAECIKKRPDATENGAGDNNDELSSLFRRQTGSLSPAPSQKYYHHKDAILDDILIEWEDLSMAWGMWMSALCEYHQSLEHQQQKAWGEELARLQRAIRFGRLCYDFCQSVELPSEQQLQQQVIDLLDEMEKRQQQADHENRTRYHARVPDSEDVLEIPMQSMVKLPVNLTTLLPPLSKPFFGAVMDPMMRHYVAEFRAEMDRIILQMSQLGEEKTENARKALAMVNLPHSLTAFRQEQNGGGIPDDLWERIETVQREKRDDRLKQELWELRDLAEAARSAHRLVERQMDEDVEMDSLFREQYPNFSGHDVQQIQKTFRQTLKNYDRLMLSAEESDTLLLQRCEILDTDPKFRFLKFSKSQLDRLLPGRAGYSGGDGQGDGHAPGIDISKLGRYLVHLSSLFDDRERLIHALRENVRSYNISEELAKVQITTSAEREAAFQEIVGAACATFDDMINAMYDNIHQQDTLLNAILHENQVFTRARAELYNQANHGGKGGTVTNSEIFIVKIEDALEELEQFSEHLREGRAFYDIIIPKLQKLKQQVGDVSARLTVERCEFDDRLRRNRQEQDDARMAASFGPNHGGGGGGSSSNGGGHNHQHKNSHDGRPQAYPGVESVSHGVPDVRVDDEKLASLVAMDFDPEKVVAALKKYDNNFDQALNELLG